MMPVLVKDDYIRSETKAKVNHGWLGAARESLARLTKKPEKGIPGIFGLALIHLNSQIYHQETTYLTH